MLDLCARLFVQRRLDAQRRSIFLARHQEALEHALKLVEVKLLAAPQPFQYAGEGYWIDTTVRKQNDLELKA